MDFPFPNVFCGLFIRWVCTEGLHIADAAVVQCGRRQKSKSNDVTSLLHVANSSICLCSTTSSIIYPYNKHICTHCFLRACYVMEPHWHRRKKKKYKIYNQHQRMDTNMHKLASVLQFVTHPSVCGVPLSFSLIPKDFCHFLKLCLHLSDSHRQPNRRAARAPASTHIKQPEVKPKELTGRRHSAFSALKTLGFWRDYIRTFHCIDPWTKLARFAKNTCGFWNTNKMGGVGKLVKIEREKLNKTPKTVTKWSLPKHVLTVYDSAARHSCIMTGRAVIKKAAGIHEGQLSGIQLFAFNALLPQMCKLGKRWNQVYVGGLKKRKPLVSVFI